jgi:hypothetical protein
MGKPLPAMPAATPENAISFWEPDCTKINASKIRPTSANASDWFFIASLQFGQVIPVEQLPVRLEAAKRKAAIGDRL